MQKIRFYLISLIVLLVLSLIALVYVLNAFAPDRTGNVVLLYVLVALCGFASTTLSGFYLRRLFGQREFLNLYVASASRQGLWFAMILVVSLVLLHQGLFSWLNAIFLILTFIFFESYLLSRKTNEIETKNY